MEPASMSTERRAMPEDAADTANASGVWSSPVRPSQNVAGHDRAELARKVHPSNTTVVPVDEFFKMLRTTQQTLAEFEDKITSDNVLEYLNNLSEAIGKQQSGENLIVFIRTDHKAPESHPTGTICRPDFVAIKIPSNIEPPPSVILQRDPIKRHGSRKDDGLMWSQLDAVGEIYSEGSSDEQALLQGATYTGYLLQARPDLVSVLGIFFNPRKSHFRVYFTDAWGVYHTAPIPFDSEHASPLLENWVRRLYIPKCRLNIERVGNFPGEPTFTINVEEHGKHEGCALLRAGLPFNRRSTIFTTTDNRIIKSQYVEKARRFKEGPILRRIHEFGDFPGIVRLAPVSASKQGQAIEVDVTMAEAAPSDINTTTSAPNVNWPGHRHKKDRYETLLVLQDKAGLLVDAETPLEALIAIYDLFEVTRSLFKYRKIFHRDISLGNVLLREKNWVSETPFKAEFKDMCFATHLLGENGPNAQADRWYTRVLLIDFDMAEDRGTARGGQSTDRSGTSMYMARLIRHSMVWRAAYVLPVMPQFQTEFALVSYKACVSDRIDDFPKNKRLVYDIEANKEIRYSHRLSYDAESILWLLLSWVIQIKPLRKEPQSLIPATVWMDLTGGQGADDPRKGIVGNFPLKICHPVYQDLEELLASLFQQLSGYQEQIAQPSDEQDSTRIKDEYLHEACQRIILDFIMGMIKKPFMQEKISPTRRPREYGGEMVQSTKISPIYIAGVKRSHDAMEGTQDQSSSDRVSKKTKRYT